MKINEYINKQKAYQRQRYNQSTRQIFFLYYIIYIVSIKFTWICFISSARGFTLTRPSIDRLPSTHVRIKIDQSKIDVPKQNKTKQRTHLAVSDLLVLSLSSTHTHEHTITRYAFSFPYSVSTDNLLPSPPVLYNFCSYFLSCFVIVIN